jgi:hypothetical protein
MPERKGVQDKGALAGQNILKQDLQCLSGNQGK